MTARAAQLRETELKNEAAKLLRSPDPMHRMEGKRQMEQIAIFAKEWRSQLSPDDQATLSAIDDAYRNFAPLDAASKKYASTLFEPEAYTPRDVARVTRKGGDSQQRDLATQAQRIIGPDKPRTTFGGSAGLGGVGLASILSGQHVPAAVAAALAYGYGTKPGQAVARGLQRTLTSDEMAIAADALRRGVVPATRDNGNEQ